ncbi:MAG: hypothetical protein ACREGA_04150 [Candidatus Saccharimonadales bacterium]
MNNHSSQFEHDNYRLERKNSSSGKKPEPKKPKPRSKPMHVPLPQSAAEKHHKKSKQPEKLSKPNFQESGDLPLHQNMSQEWEIPLHASNAAAEPAATSKLHRGQTQSRAESESSKHQAESGDKSQPQAEPKDLKSGQQSGQEQEKSRQTQKDDTEPQNAAASQFAPAAEQSAEPALKARDEPALNVPPPTIAESPNTPEPQWQMTESWPDPEWMQPGAAPADSPFFSGQPLDGAASENYYPAAKEPAANTAASALNHETLDLAGSADQLTNPFEELVNKNAPRIEHSAWHRIEVDPRTGRPLANPELEYGQAFAQEQKPESAYENPANPASQNDDSEAEISAASGQLAVGHSPDVNLPPVAPEKTKSRPARKNYDLAKDFGTFSQMRSPLANFNTDNLLLWSGVVLVILAIILALAL